ncbi:sulfurtransferase TusA family protein [Elioraea rosea]|uniref:sulfurtransferase TusA family protein n=1 Tax=Elioraea rosea TaxID=2492390 RepID=UPI001185B560|nr:sulfurtransferase TusA family protein [Elioraea rosea]
MTANSDDVRKSAIDAADIALDITADICPMTFVRTRLLLDRSAPGAVLTVRLKGREPLANVPRSARDLGHTVVSLAPETPGREGEGDPWLLTLRKKG